MHTITPLFYIVDGSFYNLRNQKRKNERRLVVHHVMLCSYIHNHDATLFRLVCMDTMLKKNCRSVCWSKITSPTQIEGEVNNILLLRQQLLLLTSITPTFLRYRPGKAFRPRPFTNRLAITNIPLKVAGIYNLQAITHLFFAIKTP